MSIDVTGTGARRRARRALAGAMVGAMVLAACGGGDSGGGSASGNTTADTIEPFDDTCPDLSDALETINQATWAVYGEVIIPTEQGPQLRALPIGTAWTVDRRLLVTNAHVTEAFVDYAKQGVQFERAIAIQAGTGTVVELLRQLTHPGYTGDPLTSPDVGLFTTRHEMTGALPLAADDVEIELGAEVQIVGFPGDVTEFIQITPGETVPQATSLNGQVTALRSHDDTQQVTVENLDVIQHQAPTTPGTSGSSMVSCGEVIGVNNAGTVKMIATPSSDGSLQIDRTAAAANNFAVHVRHIRELLELFEDNALQGAELPVDAVVPQTNTGGGGGGGGGGGDNGGGQAEVFVLDGQVDEPYPHQFEIEVSAGQIVGVSSWGGGSFNLSGQLFEDGSLFFIDDASEASDGQYSRGFYEGYIVDDVTIEGVYYEEGNESSTAAFRAVVRQ